MRPWRLWSAITTTKTRVMTGIAIAVTFAAVVVSTADADPAQDGAQKKVDAKGGDFAKKGDGPPPAPQKVGLLLNDSRTLPGYNLINGGGNKSYLFDNEGRAVHTWSSEHPSGLAVYLLENGHLFRPAEATKRKPGFQGPAAGGRIQEFDWDGNLVWDFEYHSEKRLPHHDAIKLPNGNALLICWEMVDEKEAVEKGRRPETVKGSHLQPDALVEIKPTGKTTGEVVWEWRSWDHLVQDRDKTKPGYGNISEHPELFDVNFIHGEEDQVSQMMATKDGRDKLRSLGYVGSASAAPEDAKKASPEKDAQKVDADKADTPKGETKDAEIKSQKRGPRKEPDWMHVNAVDYNADLDQIVLSSPHSARSGSSTTAPRPRRRRATTAAAGEKGAISSIAGATREPIATELSSINASSASTTSSGSRRGSPAKAICSSSITGVDASPKNTRRSMSSYRRPIRTANTLDRGEDHSAR